jgi:hypothetical protein
MSMREHAETMARQLVIDAQNELAVSGTVRPTVRVVSARGKVKDFLGQDQSNACKCALLDLATAHITRRAVAFFLSMADVSSEGEQREALTCSCQSADFAFAVYAADGECPETVEIVPETLRLFGGVFGTSDQRKKM